MATAARVKYPAALQRYKLDTPLLAAGYLIPKYRKRIMYGKIKADVREILKQLCSYRKIEIVEGALMIHDRYPETINGWSKSFWARGYYVATVGNITEDAVKKYIQEQKEESHVNDSGFWLVNSLLEIDEKTTLKSWKMMETIIGFTGLICAVVISFFA